MSKHNIPASCLAPAKCWLQPEDEHIRELLKLADLTGSEAAAFLGISDARTVRRWTSGKSKIPYSSWALLCIVAGLGNIWEDFSG